MTTGVRPIRSIRPAAAGLLMIVIGTAAALTITAFRVPVDAILPHAPPGPWLRVTLAIAWVGLQLATLVAAYAAGPLGFGVACFSVAAGGVLVMSAGRAGIAGLATWAPLSATGAAALIGLGVSLWLMFRNLEATKAGTAWRTFFWLSLVGSVYLFTAHPAEWSAQMLAITATLAVCGCSALFAPWLPRGIRSLDRMSPGRLSVLMWVLCDLILVANGLAMRAIGAQTPQVQLGGLSFAPYFIAAGLIPFAVALDLHDSANRGWRALVPSAIGFPIAAILYVGLLAESGTVAVVTLSILTVVLLVGTPLQAFAAAATVLVGNVTLASPAVVGWIAYVAPRVSQRLLVWSDRQAPPDQLVRVMEVFTSAGILGHVGAGRLRFLVGPEVAKDYMPALVLANGGWIGLAIVGLASFLLVAELYRLRKSTRSVVGGALQTAVLALVVGNLLVTTLWIGGMTPFVGVPLPVLARAGSHLVVLALALVLFDAAAAADRVPATEDRNGR